MKKNHFRATLTVVFAGALALGSLGSSSVQSSVLAHERLRIFNNFRTPEEVVSYYCARDASGFVWSGLLDAERSAFTMWKQAPAQDSFYIAREYKVSPHQASGADQARVDVSYDLVAAGDAHGTTLPVPPPKERHVLFELKKVSGIWKIEKPDPAEISPIVLQSKFPVAAAN